MSALFQFFAKIWIRVRWLLGQSCWGKTSTLFCPWGSNYLGNENSGTKLNCLPPAWIYWLCSPDVTWRMGLPLGTSPCGSPWWMGSIVKETQTFFMAYENITQAKTKRMKRPLTESESKHETDENFYQFIVLESIEETPIAKLSLFLIQKTIETHCKPINIQKTMNNSIIIHTTNQKQSEKILKWKQFGKLNVKTYPQPTLNFSKGVIKSPDLALCSLEEIRLHLKPQGITDVRRISICKETRTTNTYILTFNKPTTPTSIRIGYINT